MGKIVLYKDKLGCPRCGRVILFNKDDSVRRHRESQRPRAKACDMDCELFLKMYIQALRKAMKAEDEAKKSLGILERMLETQPSQRDSLEKVIAKKTAEANSFRESASSAEKILNSLGYTVCRAEDKSP